MPPGRRLDIRAIENAGCSLCLVEGPWIDREKLFAIANRVKSPFQY